MRCYACDCQEPSHFDGSTGRYYCHTCMEIINDTIFVGDFSMGTEFVINVEDTDEQDTDAPAMPILRG